MKQENDYDMSNSSKWLSIVINFRVPQNIDWVVLVIFHILSAKLCHSIWVPYGQNKISSLNPIITHTSCTVNFHL